MQTTTANRGALTAQGIEALRRGDAARARGIFEAIVASGEADVATHVGLHFACRAQSDTAAAMAAIDSALALEPRNLQTLIVKGDFLTELGDARAAASFYRAAVASAPPQDKLAPELKRELERANAMCVKYAHQFESHLERTLAERGFRPEATSPRFRESLELLYGRKEIYFQRPRYYYFPGLAPIQFFDREAFPWLGALEARAAEIRAELLEVLKEDSAFKPYVEGDPNRPYNPQEGMLNNPAWSAFYLWKNGERIEANAARCPRTMAALDHVPLCRAANRSPSVLFSLLKPGAHIPPHNGMVNTRLIGHLPLIVPGPCDFRVGNETRRWEEGRAWIFDDTIEHEAWNRSDGTRVILLFEIWRPELTDSERALVTTMFEAIDAHSGEKPRWEI